MAEGLHLTLARPGGVAELIVDRLGVGERQWKHLRLRCPELRLSGGELRCKGGSLTIPGLIRAAAVDLAVAPGRPRMRLRLAMGAGERIDIDTAGEGLRVDVRGFDLARLRGWFPQLTALAPQGRLDAEVEWQPDATGGRVSARGEVSGGAFSSADGLHAADGLVAAFEMAARGGGNAWQWQGGLRWRAGEAYLHPLYLIAGPTVSASGRLDGRRLTVASATLDMEGVRSIAANGVFDLSSGTFERGALAVSDADLAVVGPRYLAPLLMPAQAEGLRFSGRASAGLEVVGGAVVAVDASFENAGVAMEDKGLAFGPVSGALPWRRTGATTAELVIGGGRWQKLELGPFTLDARLQGEAVDVAQVRIPVLDGALVLHDLSLRRRPEGWEGHGGAVVEPVAMDALTAAVGVPVMSGILSASLPGVTVAPGSVTLDGALVVSVFDGYLRVTGLHVLEPFGVAPHAYADIEARHLDLAQITRTFDFGTITGYVDADVRALELARWRPVRFDARVASSPGDYPRRISQRAVENISALGGVGAAAAIQRSFLRFFETFGYRDIGLSCVLADGVCRMGGIGEASGAGAGPFRLVRGGGVPALNVIGYNRRVDWNELIDRLRQAIASNAAPIVR